jgi:ribonuclease D
MEKEKYLNRPGYTYQNMFYPTITKELIQELPAGKFGGRIYIIDSLKEAAEIKPIVKNIRIFGFDTETRPSFKKGKTNKTALIQLANSDNAFIFRINIMGIPDFLIEIFENKDIIKSGVALKHDLASLQKIKPFNPASFIDLQNFVEQFGIKDKGLRKLAANILGLRIIKGQQTSNWESRVLKQIQIEYAATDAWVCHEIYNKLSMALKSLL